MVWFGLVLWHINHCRLFNAESSLYIYEIYMIIKHFFDNFFIQTKVHFYLHIVQWFQVLLCITNNSIKHQSFD